MGIIPIDQKIKASVGTLALVLNPAKLFRVAPGWKSQRLPYRQLTLFRSSRSERHLGGIPTQIEDARKG